MSLCANGCMATKPTVEVASLTVQDVQTEIASFYGWLRQSKQLLTRYHYKGWPKPIPLDPKTEQPFPPEPILPLSSERLEKVLKEMPAGSSSPVAR